MGTLSSDLGTLSHEGYVFLYPLVLMEVTRRQMTNVPAGERPGFGPPNEFEHLRQFPPAEFRAVVRPNFDTLYSSSWLDLTRGPVQIDVADSGERYYMLPMLDMWTDVFASPGKRTTGTSAQRFVVVGPGYAGEVPPEATMITAPTPHIWVIGRTQTNGADDYAAVNVFQDGLRISELAGPSEHGIDPQVDAHTEPLRQVASMTGMEFFSYAAQVLAVNPSHPTDFSQLARLALLRLVPGRNFDPGRFTHAETAEIEAGVQSARETLLAASAGIGAPVNGWISHTDSVGVYGNYYLKRAMIALVGLGANPAEDAIYPLLVRDADGAPVTGDRDYVIHFDAGCLPPVDAFWSITMYDAEGYQVANELNRFAIGDRDPIRFNPDGSLDIYAQHANPGPDRQANWLPAPTGPLGITMRMYAPRPPALDRTWNPPPVRAVANP